MTYQIIWEDFLTADEYKNAVDYCNQYVPVYKQVKREYTSCLDTLLTSLFENQEGFLYDFLAAREELHHQACFLAMSRGWQDCEFAVSGFDTLCIPAFETMKELKDFLSAFLYKRKPPVVRNLLSDSGTAAQAFLSCLNSEAKDIRALFSSMCRLLHLGHKALLPFLYLGGFESELHRRELTEQQREHACSVLLARYLIGPLPPLLFFLGFIISGQLIHNHITIRCRKKRAECFRFSFYFVKLSLRI